MLRRVIGAEDGVVKFAEINDGDECRWDDNFAPDIAAGSQLALNEDRIAFAKTACGSRVVAPRFHVVPIGDDLGFFLPADFLVHGHTEASDLLRVESCTAQQRNSTNPYHTFEARSPTLRFASIDESSKSRYKLVRHSTSLTFFNTRSISRLGVF